MLFKVKLTRLLGFARNGNNRYGTTRASVVHLSERSFGVVLWPLCGAKGDAIEVVPQGEAVTCRKCAKKAEDVAK